MRFVGRFVRDDGGFTVAGAAVALLLSCALVFASVQVFRVQSVAAEVQHVADSIAVAAENEVASFVTAVRVCDAVLLTMSLAALTLMGVGVVCMCAPPPAPAIGDEAIEAAKGFIDARNAVGEKMVAALNTMQEALPASAIAHGSALAMESSSSAVGYAAFVELAPMDAPDVALSRDFDDAPIADEVEGGAAELKDSSAAAEEAMSRMERFNREAFLHDCGNAPGYCMQERARCLAGLDESDNPMYHSELTWDFHAPLLRASKYYEARCEQEAPIDSSPAERARSALRERFYAYAYETVSKGFVMSGPEGITDMVFPLLPRNTETMMETRLYTECVYPVSEEDGIAVIHAFDGCPGQSAPTSVSGSLREMDEGVYEECPVCGLNPEAMGKVAAASSSIENGFEYHYGKVAEAATGYMEAKREYDALTSETKDTARDLFETIMDGIARACDCRIEAYPPGRFGAICAVAADWSNAPSPYPFAEGVDGGAGAAISAAVLVDDEDENCVAAFADGVAEMAGIADLVGGHSVIGSVWTSLLDLYANGVDALEEGLSETVGSLPLGNEGGLGRWAADAFMEALSRIGLAPPHTAMPKAVLINTMHVAAQSDGPLATAIREVKDAVG